MENNLYVVVGIPGAGIKKSLENFTSYAQRRKKSIKCISVDEELRSLAEPYVKRGLGVENTLSLSVLSMLLLPRKLLQDLWRKAFNQAWKKVKKQLESTHVILTLHLCYFHHSTREYFIPADLYTLRCKFRQQAKMIVTLIDDLYDCHARLFGPGGRFNIPEDTESTILDALKVLGWRSNEFLVADGLASTCGLPNYIFSVKHPIETFYDLLYSDKKKIYLSHPISEPRRMINAGNKDGALEIVSSMDQIVTVLRTKFIVFEPTAIDEFRFLVAPNGEISGNLGLRWPFQRDPRKLLYVPPSARQQTTAFPVGWEEDTRTSIMHSALLEELKEVVSNQINVRDHALVEQSDFLVCYRPLFQGNASLGVQEELKHVERLIRLKLRSKDKKSFVFSPPEDRQKYPSRRLVEHTIPEWRKSDAIRGEERSFTRLYDDVRSSRFPLDKVLTGDVRELFELLGRYDISIVPSSTAGKSPLSVSDEAQRDDHAQHLASNVRALCQVYLDDLIANETIAEYATIEEFVDELDRVSER